MVDEGHLAPARPARRPPHHARVAARAARPTRQRVGADPLELLSLEVEHRPSVAEGVRLERLLGADELELVTRMHGARPVRDPPQRRRLARGRASRGQLERRAVLALLPVDPGG